MNVFYHEVREENTINQSGKLRDLRGEVKAFRWGLVQMTPRFDNSKWILYCKFFCND